MNMRLVLGAALALAATLVANVQAQGFSVAETANCSVLYAELDALNAANGLYSFRLPEREAEYTRLAAELARLRTAPVPYASEDLTPIPAATVTGLRPTTRTVTRTEAAPNYGLAAGSLGLGGLLIFAAASSTSDETPIEMYALGGLFVAAGVVALAETRTVRDEVPDPEAARFNQNIRTRVANENRTIETENAERSRKLAEREAAERTNDAVERERDALDDALEAYEAGSRQLYESTIAALDEAGARRCVDDLLASGALLRLDGMSGEVFVIARPLNRLGALVPEAQEISSLRFSVRDLRLSEPLSRLAGFDGARRAFLVADGQVPAGFGATLDGYLVRVPIELELVPVEPDRLTLEGVLVAEQDGRTFEEPIDANVTLLTD